MASVLVQIFSAAVPLILAFIKRRHDLKDLEAGRKIVKDGNLVASPQKEKEEQEQK